MLASILPGLREIRAPLAAGYLWLITGWLLLNDRIETGADAPGAVTALTELRDALGLGVVAAAASFVAYLLGALWEPISVLAAEKLWTARSAIVYRWKSLRDATGSMPRRSPPGVMDYFARVTTEDLANEGFEPDSPPRSKRISRSAWKRLWLIGGRLSAQVDEILATRRGERVVRHSPFSDQAKTLLSLYYGWENPEVHGSDEDAYRKYSQMELGTPRDKWWIDEASDLASSVGWTYSDGHLVLDPAKPPELLFMVLNSPNSLVAIAKDDRGSVQILTEVEIVAHLFDELPLIAEGLVGEQHEHFLEASRMKGEVEFRLAMAIPIVITASVLAFGLGFPWWVWITASLAGVVAGWALLSDAWRRDAERNSYLVELLAIGKAKSPTFERLRERAGRLAGTSGAIDEVGVREAATQTAPSVTSTSPADDVPLEEIAGTRAARTP